MGKNDFRVDTTSSEKRRFSKRNKHFLDWYSLPDCSANVQCSDSSLFNGFWVQGMEVVLMSLPLHRRNCISLVMTIAGISLF